MRDPAMRLREAGPGDADAIADLHAQSWRATYRGAYRDEFLDGDVFADRRTVWRGRMSAPEPTQFVVLAVDGADVAGFACAYGEHDERRGTFLDNIHVRPGLHGQGIGATLMRGIASRSLARHPGAGLYLHVLEQNDNARRFYERLGATDVGAGEAEPAGGGLVRFRIYAWTNHRLREI